MDRLSLLMIIASRWRARWAAADQLVERASAIFDLGEILRGNRDLDHARHREGLVAADADHVAAAEVERGNADIAGVGRLEDAQLLLERFEVRRGLGRGRRRKPEQDAQDQPTAASLSLNATRQPDVRERVNETFTEVGTGRRLR